MKYPYLKNYLYSLLSVLAITITSCQEEPTIGETGTEWTMTSYISTKEILSENSAVTFKVATVTSTAKNISLALTLFQDGNFSSDGNYTIEKVTVLPNETLNEDVANANVFKKGTYILEDGKITFNQPGKEPIVGVVEITDSIITMTIEETKREPNGALNATVEKVSTVITFKEG